MTPRYRLHHELGRGAMASVHLGTLDGPHGFQRAVAIKRPHSFVYEDPALVRMLIDEARIASKISHPNVVATLDVVAGEDDLMLVMDYVHGVTLAHLVEAHKGPVDPPLAVAVIVGVLHGLHAAHEARGSSGEPLGIVHRDVSPQNILVGADGVARLADFGVAKAAGRLHTTQEGRVKGKVAYMAPEQLRAGEVDRRTDIYAASVVLWELLAGKPLFRATTPQDTLERALVGCLHAPSRHADVPEELDAIVTRGLEQGAEKRFATAREMATALERAITPSSVADVSDWVEGLAKDELVARAAEVASVTTMTDAVVTKPRPRWIWIAAPLVAAAIAGIVFFARGSASRPTTLAPPSASAMATSQPEPTAVESTLARDMPNPTPTVSVAPTPSPHAIARPVARAQPRCDPPYTIDAAGHKIYKRECLP